MNDAPTEDSAEADSARKKALIGDIVGGVGLVTAAIGVVVVLSAKGGGPNAARVWLGPARAGVSGRF